MHPTNKDLVQQLEAACPEYRFRITEAQAAGQDDLIQLDDRHRLGVATVRDEDGDHPRVELLDDHPDEPLLDFWCLDTPGASAQRQLGQVVRTALHILRHARRHEDQASKAHRPVADQPRA